MAATTTNNGTFVQGLGQGVALVDFWAEWCGPCRMQGRILHEMEAKLPAGARVVKVNVDEQPELAGEFGVMSIPTLILFQDGKPVRKWVGAQPATVLLAAMQQAQ